MRFRFRMQSIALDIPPHQFAARSPCSIAACARRLLRIMTISLAVLSPDLVKAAMKVACRAGLQLPVSGRVVPSLAAVSLPQSTKKKAPLESGAVAAVLFRRRDLFDWRSFGVDLFATFSGGVQ
jgi:hypothetical protein